MSMSSSSFIETYLSELETSIQSYPLQFPDARDREGLRFYFEPYCRNGALPKDAEIEEKVITSLSHTLQIGTDDDIHRLKTILLNKANDCFLLAIIYRMKYCKGIDGRYIAPALSLLLPRIMDMEDSLQEQVFEGKINELFNVATSEYTYREDQKVVQYLNQGIFGVARVIYQLHDKIKNLKERNENTAAEAMSTIQQNLVVYLKEYLTSSPDDPNALNRFYKSSQDITNLPQFDILKQHRGWNHFLANLLLAFSTLGLSVVYCAWQTRGEQFFFKNLYNTESTERLEEITQKIGDVSFPTY